MAHVLALGLMHGPAELLPISSSAHTALIPWLAGWPYERLDADRRKSFEVALHAGTAAALLITSPMQAVALRETLTAKRSLTLALATLPAALIGYACERSIERRLSSPPTISRALVIGGCALALADTLGAEQRTIDATGAVDGLLLGLAQAAALLPGVSRNGAALTAARCRGLSREAAQRLSWQAGLPVIIGASALKGRRLLGGELPPAARRELALAGASAFLSTALCERLLTGARSSRSLLPDAVYRMLFGALALRTLRRRRDRHGR